MKIVPINAATLPIYRDELARLLTDAVTHGASVGYDTLIPHEDAESYFHSLRPALAKGELLLWIARDERGVVGTVQLELCQKPNGRNRAEVVKLLVHSRARRNGVGQALMKSLEHAALQQQRGLLYLDTQAGSAAEALYRSLGYRCLGELPDYAAGPDGHYHPTVIYYKRLFAVNQPSRAIAS
ncbi:MULTISPECIES: GNAT family N-acetyltransferase [Serratia]|jgi:acetyltransferase|uniref:Acetyltransferase n=1 Tax=Serratia marcescens TaxID=615 RepID=A0A1C3HLU1_SERMA|nr:MULTISPECIES: GNAT family N-acetyltransferase [Serratia]MBF8221012.1 GNAT family N-acetyltransferase [Serratia ureilytica]MDU6341674.1 GNAT family N-acetyltransferase [Clostridium sp.]RNW02452.1 GNAT family N-acetyltransferase [Serratia nematodiphila]ASL90361.1 N-acetyltransferase [Serratia marcescens]EIG9090578.1 GNAT family N-acetyltransferase [Serratia marcescens]